MKAEKKKTRKTLIKELEFYREKYTHAIYSIMEMRHALGDTEATWSHVEVVNKIKELTGTLEKEDVESQPNE
jgi:hypothetical protein